MLNFITGNMADFEQYVNDRRRSSSSATGLPPDLMPDTAPIRPMLWAVLPKNEVTFLSDAADGNIPDYCKGLIDNQKSVVYFPIHPLESTAYSEYELIESGSARVSASYRTFFYEENPQGVIKFAIPQRSRLMIKLHLQEPILGVEGDRRLTPEIIEKCILFSRELEKLRVQGELYTKLLVAREEVGMLHRDRGAIIRRLPAGQIIPAFSLSSLDGRDSSREIMCIAILQKAQEMTGVATPELFGEIFARPLYESLLSAFVQGFSLEMHMQNTLFKFSSNGFVKNIIYRDLEGIVFSDKFRVAHGLSPLFNGIDSEILHKNSDEYRRFFNRNLDHDVSRILENILDANLEQGYWTLQDVKMAAKSVKRILREELARYGLVAWALLPRLFKISRSPYGNGTRRFHYFKCRFR